MSTLKRLKKKAFNFGKNLKFKINHQLGNDNEVIWILGDGRSGTTWVADLINHEKNYREIFEPFHPDRVPEASFLIPHQYSRPSELPENLKAFASKVFNGKITNNKINLVGSNLTYKGLLIKDIFANLLCYSICLEFNHIKPILLIRNPFAVSLSKYKKKDWFWTTEPLDFLNQTELYKDFLTPFESLIKDVSKKNNYFLNQILIWSIINFIPLCQFKPDGLYVCFYESIFVDPISEVSNIFSYLKGKENYSAKLNKEIIYQPSRVSGPESNILSGKSPISSWKNEISSHVISDGLYILNQFGFKDLYDADSMPDMEVFKSFHFKNKRQQSS